MSTVGVDERATVEYMQKKICFFSDQVYVNRFFALFKVFFYFPFVPPLDQFEQFVYISRFHLTEQ